MARGFWRGLTFGAAIGAVTGVLMAPKSGRETRGELKQKGQEATDKARTTIDDLTGATDQKVDSAADKAGAAVEKGRRAAKQTTARARRAARPARTATRRRTTGS